MILATAKKNNCEKEVIYSKDDREEEYQKNLDTLWCILDLRKLFRSLTRTNLKALGEAQNPFAAESGLIA